jgi:hypothetical protein
MPYQQRPPRFRYELTARGHRLADVLHLLAAWSAGDAPDAVRHELCGTPLEVRWWCPTCDRQPNQDHDLHHL